MNDIVQDLRHALRTLRRTPGFTVVAVLTLALGIGATSAIFTVLDGVVLRPLPYPESERLVRIDHPVPGLAPDARWDLSPGGFFHYRAESRTLEALAVYRTANATLTGDGPAARVRSASVSGEMFAVLRARPTVGRLITPEDDEPATMEGGWVLPGPAAPVAVLGHAFWQDRFGGDPGIVGHTILIDDEAIPVVGVLEAGIHLPHDRIDIWMPLGLNPAARATSWHNFAAIGRLGDGTSLAAAQAELTAITSRFPESMPDVYGAIDIPVSDWSLEGFRVDVRSLRDSVVGGVRGALWMLLGAVGLILVIALANVANLFLIRAEDRRHEAAIRTALGGTRRDLLRLSLVEAAALSALAWLLALAFSAGAIRALLALAPSWIPRVAEVGIGWRGAGFAAALAAVAALVFGLLPALRPAVLAGAIRGGRQSAPPEGQAARRLLVVGQMALALVLLAGAGLLARSFDQLRNVDPGLEPAGVLTLQLSLPAARYPTHEAASLFHEALAARVEALPGVRRAGFTSYLPLSASGPGCSAIFLEDRPDADPPCVPTLLITPGLLEALAIPVGGGIPDWGDVNRETGAVVVSAALARRLWPGEDPIGKGLRPNGWGEPFYRVVGLASDVPAEGLDLPPLEAVYLPLRMIGNTGAGWTPQRAGTLVVRAEQGDPAALVGPIRDALAGLDADVPVANVRPMSEVVSESMARVSFTLLLLGVAALMALLLAGIGLFGVLSYVMARRTHEIGVRIALGARVRQVSGMVVRQALALAVGGVLLGLGGALIATRVLRSFLFEVSPADPLTLGAVSLLLLAIALVAAWLPALRAARVDPMVALRAE